MKKLSFLLVLGILMFSNLSKVNGQAALLVLLLGDKAATENFNFSLIAGLNVSSLSAQSESKFVPGLNFGLGINIKLSNTLFLVPEFKAISSKGFENKSSLSTGDESIDDLYQNVKTVHTLNYIDVPVLLHYRFHKRFQTGIGPQVSFLTNANEKFYNSTGVFEQDIKESLNKTDFGVAANVTYMLSTKRNGKGFNIQFRYYRGFSNVFTDSGHNSNNVFSFNVEFPFINDEAAKK